MGNDTRSAGRPTGFSFVEILIAIAILSFVALGIAGLFSHSMVVNASAHDYALLSSQARWAMEALQARTFADAVLVDTAGTPRTWVTQTPTITIEYTVDDYHVENWAEAAGVWPVPCGRCAERGFPTRRPARLHRNRRGRWAVWLVAR